MSRGQPASLQRHLPIGELVVGRPHRSDSISQLTAWSDKTKVSAEKRIKVPGVDTETQLLEANRRRLLQQQDWVGIAPSRPVRIRFPSIREKDRIGKRRKIDKRPGHQTNTEDPILRQPPYAYNNDDYPGPYMSGALPVDHHNEDIKIRIGIDALASQTSIQQSHHAPSQHDESCPDNSSDPMLFDDEELCSAPVESRPSQPSVSNGQTDSAGTVMTSHANDRQHFRLLEDDHPQEVAGRLHTRCSSRHDESEMQSNATILRNPVDKHVQANAQSHEESAGSDFQFDGGVEHQPLRLTFDQPYGSSGEFGGVPRDDSLDHASGANAGFPDFGRGRSQVGNERRKCPDKAYEQLPTIVDEGRWRAFVDIPETSSTCSPSLSQTPRLPTKRDVRDYGTTTWSQHATAGNQTCAGVSSPMSASLPSIKRTDDRARSGTTSHIGSSRQQITSGRQSHGIDESEKLWRTFVFAEHDEHESDATPVHEDRIEARKKSATSTKDRSEVLPSCVAVASSETSKFYPTLSESASRHASRISDQVQERAPALTMSPRPRFHSTISPILRASGMKNDRQALNVQDTYEYGVLPPGEDDRFGISEGRSVTHASLFNDMSHNTFSSTTFGSGLDPRIKSRQRFNGPSSEQMKKRYRYGQRSSVYDIPVSDNEG